MTAWTLFYHPMTLRFDSLLWLLLPLCASVAIVYKTIRSDNIHRLHLQILSLTALMLAGLVALGLGLWLLHEFWPF